MQAKWKVLSATLKGSGAGYHQPRLEPGALASRYYAGRAVIRETKELVGNRTILAYAALWRCRDPFWYELGTVWVGECLRGNGVRDELMAELLQRVPEDRDLFFITPVEAIMRSGEKLGFVPVTTQTHPLILEWACRAGIVSRLPSSVHPIAPGLWGTPKGGQRWLFWRRSG